MRRRTLLGIGAAAAGGWWVAATGADDSGHSSGGGRPDSGFAAPDIDTAAAEQLIRDGIDETRAREGREALAADATLREAAHDHARDMAERDFYGHVNPDGEQPWDRVACQQASETIHRAPYASDAYNAVEGGGQQYDCTTAEGVAKYTVEGWRLSDSHREILLRRAWTRVGLGVVVDAEDDATFVVAMFC